MKYWLLKSEAEVFSLNDLKNSPGQTTCWDGVRNYQARNFIRDEMKAGDKALFYHSNSEPNLIAGICKIVKEAYPDYTAFDPDNEHYDPKSKKENPAWFMVDVKWEEEFKNPVTLQSIKANPKLKNMRLVQPGNRLSVMPITKDEFEEILKMSK